MPKTNYIDIMEKNHMEIPWHDYTNADSNALISDADLIEKASVIGRVGLIMLSCGTGAWRVRTSMNRLSKELGVTCTVDVGLMSIEFNCFDGNDCVSQSLSIANTGVNTSKLYRMEQFVDNVLMKLNRYIPCIHRSSLDLPPLLRAVRSHFFLVADLLKCFSLLSPPVQVI